MYHFTEFYESLAEAENRIIPHLSCTLCHYSFQPLAEQKCVTDWPYSIIVQYYLCVTH